MKIVVAGCGKIGSTFIENLSAEGHDIMATDADPTVIEDISNMYDVMCVGGSATDYDTLREAGVDEAELFIAATGSDELNLLSCFLAKRMGAKHTAARIRNPEYNDEALSFIRKQMDLSLPYNPDLLAAQDLFNVLRFPSAIKLEYFSLRNFVMAELLVKDDTPFSGHTLIELRKRYSAKFLVCVVQRKEENGAEKLVIPDGNFILKPGDRIELTAERGELHKLLRDMGILKKQARSVMLLGACRTAYYLSRLLINFGVSVTIIDHNEKNCKDFSEKLPEARVICGDGAQQELLLSEGLRSMDAFVSMTGMDEENILFSYFAASQGVEKVVTKVNRDDYKSIAEKLGLETIFSPKDVAADTVCSYARALDNSLGSNVETLYKLMDGRVEALEFRVTSDFSKIDVPLMQMKLRPGILIAGIMRGRKALLPTGTDSLHVGDRVAVISAGARINDLSDILA